MEGTFLKAAHQVEASVSFVMLARFKNVKDYHLKEQDENIIICL